MGLDVRFNLRGLYEEATEAQAVAHTSNETEASIGLRARQIAGTQRALPECRGECCRVIQIAIKKAGHVSFLVIRRHPDSHVDQ